jgi:hypothetical protein
LKRPLLLILFGGFFAGRLAFDNARAASQNSGRLAGSRIFLEVARSAIRYFEVLVNAAELQRKAVERRVRAGGKYHRIGRRDAIQLRARGIALLAQSSDEHLAHLDPLAGA